jgi:DNA-binding MarR family transcriptional regulator
LQSPLQQLICFNFYVGWRSISAFYRRYLPDSVTPQQSYVLECCERERGVLMHELAGLLMIAPPAVSMLVGRMERSGLLERRPDTENRREVRVHLTADGESVRSRIREAMVDADKILFSRITQGDLDQLKSLVSRIETERQRLDEAEETEE